MSEKRRRLRRPALCCVVLIAAYIAGSLTLPFLPLPKVGETYMAAWKKTAAALRRKAAPAQRAMIVETPREALDIRLRLLERAKTRIIYSTFDFREDESGTIVAASLWAAAERGVGIKLLVDGMNGASDMLGHDIFALLGAHPNVEIRFYNRPSIWKPWTFNGRMHDKYMIIDQEFLLLGGRNTSDLFLGEADNRHLSDDREIMVWLPEAEAGGAAAADFRQAAAEPETATDLRQAPSAGQAAGLTAAPSARPALRQLEDYFNSVWELPVTGMAFEAGLDDRERASARGKLEEVYATQKALAPELYDPSYDFTEATVPIDNAALIHNPTTIMAKEPWVWYSLQSLMEEAESRALIHTPYAVLSKPMVEGLRRISERGIEAEMLINAPATGENLIGSADYVWNQDKLLDTGLGVWEYYGERSSHGKSLLIDDDLAVVGSFNWDMRSAYLDTELMLAVYGEEFNQLLTVNLERMKERAVALERLPDGSVGHTQAPDFPLPEAPLLKRLIIGLLAPLTQLFRFLV